MIGKTSGTSTVYLIKYSVSVYRRLKSALCLYIPGKVSDSCWVMSEVLLLRGRGLSLPPSSSSPPHSDSWHSSTSDSREDKEMVRQRCNTYQISWKHTGMWLADTVQTEISRIWNMVRKNRACKHATVIHTLVKDSTKHRGNLEKCISKIIQQHGLNQKVQGAIRETVTENEWERLGEGHATRKHMQLSQYFTWESVRASRVTRRDTRQERAHSVEQHRNTFSSGQSLV